jgi:hypothetical protein
VTRALGGVLLFATALAACESMAPRLPPGAQRFTPPSIYQQWWALTEQCSGRSGNFADVRWYRVPGAIDIPLGDGTMVNGLWKPDGNEIVLAGESELAGDLVRHEMLHALLRTPGHDRSEFVGRCGGTVACIGPCLTDGGPPPPDPAAVAVAPSTLEIEVEVVPNAPGASVNDGMFMMIITARNPARTPVIVQLPPSGDAGPSVTYEYRVTQSSFSTESNVREDAPEETRFAPLEEKRFIFDFHVGSDNGYVVPPGTYRFGGAYGDAWAPNPPTVTISP